MLTRDAGQPRELALRLVLESDLHGREYFDHLESLDDMLAALRQVLEETIAIAAADRVERLVGVAVVPRENYGSEDGYGYGLEARLLAQETKNA
jgi:hypothetical protein